MSLEKAWPASQFRVLADAGNGVITQSFLDGPFTNWNFEANLPTDIPGVRESLDNGTGIPGYTEAVAEYFPQHELGALRDRLRRWQRRADGLLQHHAERQQPDRGAELVGRELRLQQA